ncbi:hypothetical protein K1719_016473 [Acacia pycnantha]|nr:hypothetical protein K1719_016473 [Acacia pycnantha]
MPNDYRNDALFESFDVPAPKQEEVKRLPGGKMKRVFLRILAHFQIRNSHNLTLNINVRRYVYRPFFPTFRDKQEVVIEKIIRNKRKCITTVKGLDLFGVKLSDASKKLWKKFATGAFICQEIAIFFMEDGKKVPAVLL